jgi:hypothetical protein
MEPTTLTDASTSRWNMSKGTPFRLHESAVFYHQPRRKLLLKKLLVTLNSFNFSNHYKKRWSLQRNLKCLDYRVRYTLFGPFLSHEEIHSFLRGHVPIRELYTGLRRICHAVSYLSISDLLHPRNLIVRDGKIVAVVGWQFAGWYPEDWEHQSAFRTSQHAWLVRRVSTRCNEIRR